MIDGGKRPVAGTGYMTGPRNTTANGRLWLVLGDALVLWTAKVTICMLIVANRFRCFT